MADYKTTFNYFEHALHLTASDGKLLSQIILLTTRMVHLGHFESSGEDYPEYDGEPLADYLDNVAHWIDGESALVANYEEQADLSAIAETIRELGPLTFGVSSYVQGNLLNLMENYFEGHGLPMPFQLRQHLNEQKNTYQLSSISSSDASSTIVASILGIAAALDLDKKAITQTATHSCTSLRSDGFGFMHFHFEQDIFEELDYNNQYLRQYLESGYDGDGVEEALYEVADGPWLIGEAPASTPYSAQLVSRCNRAIRRDVDFEKAQEFAITLKGHRHSFESAQRLASQIELLSRHPLIEDFMSPFIGSDKRDFTEGDLADLSMLLLTDNTLQKDARWRLSLALINKACLKSGIAMKVIAEAVAAEIVHLARMPVYSMAELIIDAFPGEEEKDSSCYLASNQINPRRAALFIQLFQLLENDKNLIDLPSSNDMGEEFGGDVLVSSLRGFQYLDEDAQLQPLRKKVEKTLAEKQQRQGNPAMRDIAYIQEERTGMALT